MSHHPIMSRKKAHVLTFALFLIGLGILLYLQNWWPSIMLVVGIPLALRQYLLGRHWDMGVTLVVFIGVFVTVQFNIPWKLLLPILFTLGGLYIFFREFFGGRSEMESEHEEDMNFEIEEKTKHKHKK